MYVAWKKEEKVRGTDDSSIRSCTGERSLGRRKKKKNCQNTRNSRVYTSQVIGTTKPPSREKKGRKMTRWVVWRGGSYMDAYIHLIKLTQISKGIYVYMERERERDSKGDAAIRNGKSFRERRERYPSTLFLTLTASIFSRKPSPHPPPCRQSSSST